MADTVYNIDINEEQRKYIVEAIKHFQDAKGSFDKDVSDSILYLKDCLEKIPEDQKQYPGCTHGLCY